MSRIAVLEPGTLLGQEILEAWSSELPGADEPVLLTQREDDVGVLTRVGDSASVLRRIADVDLEDFGIVLCCDLRDEESAFLEDLPASVAAVVMPAIGAATPYPARVAARGEFSEIRVVSAHPAIVASAEIIAALSALDVRGVEATAVLPVSMHSPEALDEVLEQARSILAFAAPRQSEIFGGQLVFNLLPAQVAQTTIQRQIVDVFGDLPVALHCVQAGVFHAVSLSLHCRLRPGTGLDEVKEALDAAAGVESVEEADQLGPIRAAGASEVLVGEPSESGVEGGFWLWAVMDNLTRGGAFNALGLARRILAR